MDENCTHDCSTCGSDCASRQKPESMQEPMNQYSDVKNVIAVVSGKGGVGKSLVTSLMACKMRAGGSDTAILDADITGPSIPKVFGLDDARAEGSEAGILPKVSQSGIEMISVNLLLEDTGAPVVWRGPVIAGVVKQFWSEVCWGDVDYMFVDMPPGTGDVPLTVFQSLPVKGILIVTSPQELVGMIVEKAVRMAEMMNVPVLGIVENMSYYECPDCGKRHSIFGESHLEETAQRHGIRTLARLPIDPAIAKACDAGKIEELSAPWLDEMAAAIREALPTE
ncbi:MAG: Mrp/NBP35 family ATP-binding protein [Ruminococcaceae bacterium]|nr:Mrp/NBP35 family ATP-binding protein [Oscillospiraceae bacterium]